MTRRTKRDAAGSRSETPTQRNPTWYQLPRRWAHAALRLQNFLLALCAFASLLTFTDASAQQLEDPRSAALSELNLTPPFLVRVDVDRADRLYRGGETIQVSVRSEREGYLHLFYCDASGQTTCLFPNQIQADNRILANETVIVPAAHAPFQLRVGPPFGTEVLKAIVTTEPLQSIELETLTKGGFTPLKPGKLKAVFVEAKENYSDPSAGQPHPRQWAEHHLQIVTLAPDQTPPATPQLNALPQLADLVQNHTAPSSDPAPQTHAVPGTQPPAAPAMGSKRVGIFIGVSRYQDPGIRPLRVADLDAKAMAQVMQEQGQLDESVVLVNEQATLANVQQLIQTGLPAATRPGDLVLIYWSGHGGRTSNLDGTEPDGFDEYLIPYDGRLDPADAVRKTMLLDKTFGRWTLNLDGRQLVVILDACHSGGQTQGAIKSISGGDSATPFRGFFFANAFARAKDIGQRETAVIASSRASQISFEQRGRQLSVMTHFLVEKLRSSTGPVSIQDAAAYVAQTVPPFVQTHYPGTTQTPVFVDYTTPPVLLRP
jgi:hypothetical protein